MAECVGGVCAMTFDRQTLNRLYRYCFSLTGDETGAYDLLQSGVERYLRHAPQDLAAPVPYLQRLLRNLYIDQLRRRNRYPEESLETYGDDIVGIGLQVLEQQAIARADAERIWDVLNPLERELLYFWAVEEMTAAEIAERLACPRNTILSCVHRLRLKLRVCFGDDSTVTALKVSS